MPETNKPNILEQAMHEVRGEEGVFQGDLDTFLLLCSEKVRDIFKKKKCDSFSGDSAVFLLRFCEIIRDHKSSLYYLHNINMLPLQRGNCSRL